MAAPHSRQTRSAWGAGSALRSPPRSAIVSPRAASLLAAPVLVFVLLGRQAALDFQERLARPVADDRVGVEGDQAVQLRDALLGPDLRQHRQGEFLVHLRIRGLER